MTTTSIVISAYNEERGIVEIARRVLAVKLDLTKVGVRKLELLVVDEARAIAPRRRRAAWKGSG
jgi:glycosyltransferase involved in cell wall biosynthesis